jgi:hypothetical protein
MDGRENELKKVGRQTGRQTDKKQPDGWAMTDLLYLEFSLGMCGIYLHFPCNLTRTSIQMQKELLPGNKTTDIICTAIVQEKWVIGRIHSESGHVSCTGH